MYLGLKWVYLLEYIMEFSNLIKLGYYSVILCSPISKKEFWEKIFFREDIMFECFNFDWIKGGVFGDNCEDSVEHAHKKKDDFWLK